MAQNSFLCQSSTSCTSLETLHLAVSSKCQCLCLGRTDPLLEVAVELEKMALSDEYFKTRGTDASIL